VRVESVVRNMPSEGGAGFRHTDLNMTRTGDFGGIGQTELETLCQ
jgi:hypothetical protein